MKPKPKNPGRGRPKLEDKVRLSVDIRPDCRAKVEKYMAENQWLLNVTVENIIDRYFAMLADKKP